MFSKGYMRIKSLEKININFRIINWFLFETVNFDVYISHTQFLLSVNKTIKELLGNIVNWMMYIYV